MSTNDDGRVAGRFATVLAVIAAAVLALVGQPSFATIGLPGTNLRAQEVGSVGAFPRSNTDYFYEHLTPPDQVVAIRAGRLFQANSGTMLTDQVVLINGERIAAVGPDVDIPGGATVIDLSDATVLPGMIDTHTHVFPGGGTEAQRAFHGVASALKNLNAGFTTIVNVDSRGGYGTVDLRDAINAGIILGPRMQVTGQSLNQRASGPYTAASPTFRETFTEYKDYHGPWAARAAVREAKLNGVDWVKIYTTQDFVGRELKNWNADGTIMYTPSMTYEEVEAIVDEAHRLGLKVVCHTYGGEGLQSCLRAGVDAPTHAENLDDESYRLFLEMGLPLVPTLDDLVRLEPEDLEMSGGRNSRLGMMEDAFRRLYAAGVQMPFGSGAVGAGIPHGRQADQFAILVEWGMSPAEALQTAMPVAAELLNYDWDEHLGTLEPGKLADVIAVSGDPLSDISEMERVQFVMKGGLVVRDDLTPSASITADDGG